MRRSFRRFAAASAALRAAAGALVLAGCALPLAAAPGVEPLRLRVVGGLAGVNQYTRHEEPFWRHQLARLSGGRLSAEIVPSDRAGIRATEMLRLVRLGAVPWGTVLLGVAAVDEPVLGLADLAGLNPDLAAMRRSAAAFRPQLAAALRERHGAELLALYVYPAQATFCTRPLDGLSDLAGRRVRVSGASQADLMSALGALPVQTPFADLMPHMRSGRIDCAVTGTMSGHTIGLDRLASHLHPTPIGWGLAAFVANTAAWNALPAELQALLGRELPRLERDIWDEAARETDAGIACNTGAPSCPNAHKGRMTLARTAAQDDAKLLRDLFALRVLPAWMQRCGAACAAVWRQTVDAASGIEPR